MKGPGMKGEACCAGGAAACRADQTGALRCLGGAGAPACVAAGRACAISEQCCGGLCRSDGTGALVCHDGCAPLGAPCRAGADCCGESCAGAPGAAACVAVGTATPTGERCAAAGEPCDPIATDCCQGTVCAALPTGGFACAAPGT